MKKSAGWICAGLLLVALPAAAQVWHVDLAGSTLGFRTTCGKVACGGHFAHFAADIAYDPHDILLSKFDVAVDVASLHTDDAAWTRTALGPAFFDAARFRHAYFATTIFRRAASGEIQAVGQLSLRGAIEPVTLDLHFVQHGNIATLNLEGHLQRLAFGVGVGPWSNSALFGHDVVLRGHLVLRRARLKVDQP